MIGISLLTLNPEAAGGTLTYVRGLVDALARTGELDYRVFVPSTAPDAGGALPATVVDALPAGGGRLGRAAVLARLALAPRRLRRALRPAELDAVHFPLSTMLPRLDGPPAATTIHDLQHEAFPRFFSRGQLRYRRHAYGAAIRHSRVVIAVSEFVRGELIERYGLDADRVRAIRHGIDHGLFSPGGGPRQAFLLYPANLWPHKNHERLFRAFATVREERPGLRLVLTGANHGGVRLPPGVESRGHVSVDELVGLYRSAAALVYPSLYEGFGMPCLEAMACGCPVAAARVASLPEVCGEAAVYFDPRSVGSIAEGIRGVLDEPASGGIEQAAGFRWERSAAEHDAVYRELRDLGRPA